MHRLCRYLCVALLASTALAQNMPLPTIDGESLAGAKIMLPEAAKGKVAVLVFGFTKASKGPTRAWADRIFADFSSQSGFVLYQLPVLESVPSFIRGMVISSMKKGVPENMRDHFVPILHGETQLKRLVNYNGSDDAFLIVLDADGQIIEQKHGAFSDAAYAPLRSDLQSILSRQK